MQRIGGGLRMRCESVQNSPSAQTMNGSPSQTSARRLCTLATCTARKVLVKPCDYPSERGRCPHRPEICMYSRDDVGNVPYYRSI